MDNNLTDDSILESRIDASLGVPQEPMRSPTEVAQPNFEQQIDRTIEQRIDKKIQEETYGTTTQKTIAFGEAGLRGLISGPAAVGLELATGLTTKEDIRKRKEELGEGLNLVGEGIGFLAPTIISLGGTALVRTGIVSVGAAAKAAKLAQFTQAGLTSQAANLVAKKATSDVAKKVIAVGLEGAILATADEATKAILSPDPNAAMTNIGTSALNVGGAAVLGGALGYGAAKLPLWTAKFAKPVQQMADDLAGKNPDAITLGGVANQFATEAERKSFKQAILEKKPNADQIKQAAQRQGLPLTEAMLSKSSWVQRVASSLSKSPTIFGALERLVYDKGFDKADDILLKAMKTNLPLEASKAEVGQALFEMMDPKIRVTKDLMDSLYGEIRKQTQFVPVSEQSLKKITDKLLSLPRVVNNKRSPSTRITKEIVADLIDGVATGNYTVDNLRSVISELPARVENFNTAQKAAVSEVRDLLVDLQDKEIISYAKQMMVPDPEARSAVNALVQQIKEANKAYGPFRNDLRKLAEGLGFRISGPADFLVQLAEKRPEDLVRRLTAKGDSRLLKFMQEKFPEETKLLMDYEKNELLKRFSKREKLKTQTLIDNIQKLPKELQKAMFGEETLKSIDDVRTWINAMPENVNPTNTSQGIAFNEYFSAKGVAMTAADLGKVAVLKMISAGEKPTAAGVKAMTDYFNATHSGYTMINKAVRATLSDQREQKSFPIFDPSLRSLDAIDKQAEKFQQDPSSFMNMSGSLEDYLPEQAQAQKVSAARVYGYLNEKRPKMIQSGILDKPRPVSVAQKQDYKRTLQIAEQPGIVLKKLAQGNLQSKDIQDLNAMYPELRNQFLTEIMRQLIPKISKGEQISFKIKKGLSLFGAMPLDSNMKPQAIQAAQATYQQQGQAPEQQMPQMAPKSSRKSQLPTQAQTDQQRRILKQ
jgi:hypothetical protein